MYIPHLIGSLILEPWERKTQQRTIRYIVARGGNIQEAGWGETEIRALRPGLEDAARPARSPVLSRPEQQSRVEKSQPSATLECC